MTSTSFVNNFTGSMATLIVTPQETIFSVSSSMAHTLLLRNLEASQPSEVHDIRGKGRTLKKLLKEILSRLKDKLLGRRKTPHVPINHVADNFVDLGTQVSVVSPENSVEIVESSSQGEPVNRNLLLLPGTGNSLFLAESQALIPKIPTEADLPCGTLHRELGGCKPPNLIICFLILLITAGLFTFFCKSVFLAKIGRPSDRTRAIRTMREDSKSAITHFGVPRGILSTTGSHQISTYVFAIKLGAQKEREFVVYGHYEDIQNQHARALNTFWEGMGWEYCVASSKIFSRVLNRIPKRALPELSLKNELGMNESYPNVSEHALRSLDMVSIVNGFYELARSIEITMPSSESKKIGWMELMASCPQETQKNVVLLNHAALSLKEVEAHQFAMHSKAPEPEQDQRLDLVKYAESGLPRFWEFLDAVDAARGDTVPTLSLLSQYRKSLCSIRLELTDTFQKGSVIAEEYSELKKQVMTMQDEVTVAGVVAAKGRMSAAEYNISACKSLMLSSKIKAEIFGAFKNGWLKDLLNSGCSLHVVNYWDNAISADFTRLEAMQTMCSILIEGLDERLAILKDILLKVDDFIEGWKRCIT